MDDLYEDYGVVGLVGSIDNPEHFIQNNHPCDILNISIPGYCAGVYDEIFCWKPTPANTTAALLCPTLDLTENNSSSVKAYRHCPANASWENVKSDYSACIDLSDLSHSLCHASETLPDENMIRMAEILRDVYFILSIISLFLLIITIFIFQYFRSLHCSRISIHKHLVVSFIFRFIVNIVMIEPYISRRASSYRDLDWLCKTVTAISQYTTLANVFWMFVEGFFLHHSLVLGVFSAAPPFKLFYLIGWGLPAVFVGAWVVVLHLEYDCNCWRDYSQLQYYYIITIPFILALAINLVFLVNIIRVLVSKLRANNRIETANIRKAIKATVVLMPLLGLTNLLFFTNPGESASLQTAYHVTNAVLHSSQGIFVAILYCFMNGEVRRVIKQKWYRFKVGHVLNKGRGRRRSSRTSSFFLPSGTEVHPLRALRNKMCPALTGHVFCENSPDHEYKNCNKHKIAAKKESDPEDKVCTCACSWNSDGFNCCSCCCTDVEDDDIE